MMLPLVVMPDPLKLVLDVLNGHPALPAALMGKLVAELRDNFPANLPWVTVGVAPGGGYRLVKGRIAESAIDINVYGFANDVTAEYARTLAAILQSSEGARNSQGGILEVSLQEPFAAPDPTTAHRWIVQATITYRPL